MLSKRKELPKCTILKSCLTNAKQLSHFKKNMNIPQRIQHKICITQEQNFNCTSLPITFFFTGKRHFMF